MTFKVAVAACVWLMLVARAAVGLDDTCMHVEPSLKLDGDVTIVALFDGHSGVNCTTPDKRGLQEMATLAWMVNAINHVQIIPGIKLGLSLYDTCSTVAAAENALLTHLAEKRCGENYFLGVLTTPKISASLQKLLQLLHTPISLTNTQLLSISSITDAVTQLLSIKQVTAIDHLCASSRKTLEAFVGFSRERGICVVQTHLIGRDSEAFSEMLSGVVVVIGSTEDVKRLGDFEEDATQFVLVPTGTWEASVLDNLPSNAIIISSNPVVLRPPTSANTSQSDAWASVNRHVFLDVAATLLQTVDRLKSGLAASCPNATTQPCNNLPSFHQLPSTHTVTSIGHLFRSLHIHSDNDNAIFYTINRLQRDGNNTKRIDKLAEFRTQDPTHNHTFHMTSLTKNLTLFSALDNTTQRCNISMTNNTANDFLCRKCVNTRSFNRGEINLSEMYLFSTVSFRNEGWVAALISISTMGVLCCLAVGVFVVVRKCNGDVLEGNPSFSFLLLAAIVLTYASIVPFSIRVPQSAALCGLRIFSTCISYALVFSIMLSRSLMLASCDKEGGFMSHVNGYLQTVLCFFMSGVQLALSIQFWVINSHFLPDAEQCKFNEGPLFLVILSYDAFLLLILLCTTPFIVNSKRNYREGMFFAAGIILCTAVWIVWVPAYVLLPEYRDAVTASGLTSTATVILIAVFIPRTYLMMSALTRDNIANSLPAMAYSSTSILDLNYRSSSQALYATVSLPSQSGGQANENYYGDAPRGQMQQECSAVAKCQSGHACKGGDVTPENTYERYGTPPSPLKVTRF